MLSYHHQNKNYNKQWYLLCGATTTQRRRKNTETEEILQDLSYAEENYNI